MVDVIVIAEQGRQRNDRGHVFVDCNGVVHCHGWGIAYILKPEGDQTIVNRSLRI